MKHRVSVTFVDGSTRHADILGTEAAAESWARKMSESASIDHARLTTRKPRKVRTVEFRHGIRRGIAEHRTY
jgi:hypothetical protein